MIISAIIAEYNPFHEGHLYHIKKTKELTNPDILLIIMSGNFVQRGECAIFEKKLRAQCAILNGADIVIELPPYYAVNNAKNFAYFSTKIINEIPSIKYLSFGCEIDNIETIKELSDISEKFKNKSNENYTNARASFFSDINNIDANFFKQSNLILAIEYLKFLRSDITPIPIKRIGNAYNDIDINNNFASASAIRKAIEANNFKSVFFKNESPKFISKMYNTFINDLILNYDESQLYNRIYKNIDSYCNYDDIINMSYAKNISRSTIKRYLIRKLFKFNDININEIYSNVIAFNDKGKNLFKELKNPILRFSDYKLLSSDLQHIYLLHNQIDKFYSKI